MGNVNIIQQETNAYMTPAAVFLEIEVVRRSNNTTTPSYNTYLAGRNHAIQLRVGPCFLICMTKRHLPAVYGKIHVGAGELH